MTASEAPLLVEHREELIYLLTEAAEIEHGLMCCYLYAAFSLKSEASEGLAEEELAAVLRWRRTLLDVAREEMVHLALVNNLLTAVGGSPHLARPNFPVAPGYHPAGVTVSLAPFDVATIDHFVFLERPEGVELADGQGFGSARVYERTFRRGRIVASAQDYATVGHLYRGVSEGLVELARVHGEAGLFVGDPRLQVGVDLFSLPGVSKVVDLASALAAIETIVTQGEGSPADTETSHFRRFTTVQSELAALLQKNPSFVPARPVARNPVMRRPVATADRVWVEAEPAATLLDLANGAYLFMARALDVLFSRPELSLEARAVVSDASVTAMYALVPLAEHLTTLPANPALPGVNAGLTFTMQRSVAAPPEPHAAFRTLRENAAVLALGYQAHARGLSPRLDAAIEGLSALADRFADGPRTVAPPAPPSRAGSRVALPKVAPPPRGPTPSIEEARGKSLLLRFEAKRCIHARHCVLSAPKVFLANTPGEWIFPDEAHVETLVTVAHDCPSGAITYERLDDGPAETAPEVNVLRIRENGPLAVHAELALEGQRPMFRATLCRCGASKNKPFCDGSHAAIEFAATGEPKTDAVDPLLRRNGPLTVVPRKDGPLAVQGNLEICAGTGRTVRRTTQCVLCRCGGSKTKPFCDGTHRTNGFSADGT
ncbi:MAG: hypothetical protein HOO96_38990 [Polyangiaceae bacterium]|nr:hypothetical protein [Polyangiaceae bacterium]